MWDGSKIVSRTGIHYITVDITRLVYGGAPGVIGLKTSISIGGVTFSGTDRNSGG